MMVGGSRSYRAPAPGKPQFHRLDAAIEKMPIAPEGSEYAAVVRPERSAPMMMASCLPWEAVGDFVGEDVSVIDPINYIPQGSLMANRLDSWQLIFHAVLR
jgi:hypothetical protein